MAASSAMRLVQCDSNAVPSRWGGFSGFGMALVTSKTKMVLSCRPATRNLPSGEKASVQTPDLKPPKVASSVPVNASQILTV